MAIDKDAASTAESLRKTRTYGKFRCHNPSCMGRLQPEAGEPATQRTVIRILYDDRAVYFAIDCRDTDPAVISKRITRRDGEVWEDD